MKLIFKSFFNFGNIITFAALFFLLYVFPYLNVENIGWKVVLILTIFLIHTYWAIFSSKRALKYTKEKEAVIDIISDFISCMIHLGITCISFIVFMNEAAKYDILAILIACTFSTFIEAYLTVHNVIHAMYMINPININNN